MTPISTWSRHQSASVAREAIGREVAAFVVGVRDEAVIRAVAMGERAQVLAKQFATEEIGHLLCLQVDGAMLAVVGMWQDEPVVAGVGEQHIDMGVRDENADMEGSLAFRAHHPAARGHRSGWKSRERKGQLAGCLPLGRRGTQ